MTTSEPTSVGPDGQDAALRSGDETPPSPQGTFAQRLNALLAWYETRYGVRPSANDIARAVNASGGKISHTTVSALINGNSDNPVLKTIIGLADFFGVDPSYFITRAAEDSTAVSTDDQLRRLAQTNPRTAQQVELLFAMKEAGITRIGARGFTPTGPGREAMLRIVRGIARLTEGDQQAVARVVEAMERTVDETPSPPG